MASKTTETAGSAPVRDHRVEVAEKKRVLMRTRLVDATMRVFANQSGPPPVIDDVIREAKVSRGTFYNYFDSLDDVLAVIGQDLSNQMTTDIMPVYGVLEDPLERFAVGFRLFLTRAMIDHKWAGFVTRTDAWAQDTLVDKCMSADLEHGKQSGQFHLEDVQVAADFLKGASAHGIQALRRGVDDPVAYIDASVRMALISLGCTRTVADRAVAHASSYLKAWIGGKLTAGRPQWAVNMNARQAQLLLAPDDAPAAGAKPARKARATPAKNAARD
ncbi:MAG: TetR/AcrR family transcriptional regulator [Pseudomonadota bacterium]